MSGDARGSRTSRRVFLKAGVLGGAAATALPHVHVAQASESRSGESEPTPTAGASLFSAAERHALSVLSELVLEGAGDWAIPDYIEHLLTSFEHEPPRLYAGMVASEDEWLPLDRVRRHAWRLRIHGSAAETRPNEALLGPVRGLRPVVLEAAREAAAMLSGGSTPEWVWWRLSGDFREAFTELVLEGALGDPVYGGNRDAAGWRAFHFAGAMLGYGTSRPDAHAHATREAGEGADPLGPWTRAALWVLGFFSRRIA